MAQILSSDIETNPGPRQTSLKFFHININSLQHKIDEIETELDDYDIVAITETKLDNSVCNERILLSQYQEPFRKDRTGGYGGGIVCYARNNVTAK